MYLRYIMWEIERTTQYATQIHKTEVKINAARVIFIQPYERNVYLARPIADN